MMRSTFNVLSLFLLTIAVAASFGENTSNEFEKSATSESSIATTTEDDLELTELTNQNEAEDEKVMYNGSKVLRVELRTKEDQGYIKEFHYSGDIEIWSQNGNAVDFLVKSAQAYEDVTQKLSNYDVVIDDVQKAIEEENPTISEEELSELQGRKVDTHSQWTANGHYDNQPSLIGRVTTSKNSEELINGKSRNKPKRRRKGHRMTWTMYHRAEVIYEYLKYLATTYPKNCTLEKIGASVQGRPLYVLRISSGNPGNKAIWVDSGIHAREWISPAVSTYILNQMLENGGGFQDVDWYFLPLINPDGYEYTHVKDRLWRKNRAYPERGSCAGVDLNRNFGYRWGGLGASKRPCSETYAGTGPFSEPETSAIRKFVRAHIPSIKAYMTLHSYGQYILHPWGYTQKVPPDHADLGKVGRGMANKIRETSGQTYKVGPSGSLLYPAAGGSDDWAKGSAGIKYTFTVELRDQGAHGFLLPAQYIIPTGKEIYEAFKYLAKQVRALQ